MTRNNRKLHSGFKIVSALLTLLILTVNSRAGNPAEKKRLYSFTPAVGSHPLGLTFGPDGALYGTTVTGAAGGGAIYRLAPDESGIWFETTLYRFGVQGHYPNPVIFAPDGAMLLTLQLGPGGGCGSIIRLAENSNGTWQELNLHNFKCAEGLYPESPLTADGNGNYFGVAWGGGVYGLGTVFEITSANGGEWVFKRIHSFNGHDGAHPQSGVVFDASGNMYGTALCGGLSAGAAANELAPDCGGDAGSGTVWELSPLADGSWREKTIHNFYGHNGANPSDNGQLALDAAGNLYGTTHNGGIFDLGTVYELSPRGDGTWSSKVLHSFNGHNGIAPSGGVIFDAQGNLYGECFGPGSYSGVTSPGESGGQVVYKLSPNADGTWSETVLQKFNEPQSGGPAMGLIMDNSGNIFGTTWMGGAHNDGSVFEVTP